MAALAEHVAGASDEDLLVDAEAAGVDPAAVGSHVRGLLSASIQRAKKARLAKARAEHEGAVETYAARAIELPRDPAVRRDLLASVIGRLPGMREAVVTLQHRDFESFSDEDVESALRQLQALGLLDDDPSSDDS
jgi:hypothetical protein